MRELITSIYRLEILDYREILAGIIHVRMLFASSCSTAASLDTCASKRGGSCGERRCN